MLCRTLRTNIEVNITSARLVFSIAWLAIVSSVSRWSLNCRWLRWQVWLLETGLWAQCIDTRRWIREWNMCQIVRRLRIWCRIQQSTSNSEFIFFFRHGRSILPSLLNLEVFWVFSSVLIDQILSNWGLQPYLATRCIRASLRGSSGFGGLLGAFDAHALESLEHWSQGASKKDLI